MNRQNSSMGDELTNAAIIGLLALVGFTLLLRGAGTITAWISGTAQPTGGPASGLRPPSAPGGRGFCVGAGREQRIVFTR